VGVVDKRRANTHSHLEIDFVANKGSERYYIQSAFSIPDEEKEAQEKNSLINVNDSFKKIVVVKDPISIRRDDQGIVTVGIYEFLLNDNSLKD
jgi:predicted AAA+ superfamily ATPase